MTKHIYRLSILLLSIITFISFWIFSRFTVDDAFISWRYGKNLIDSGIWNYNPINFDMTQAYTNPIYALLSIVPNFFGWDVVLFFKIFSLVTICGFFYWFAKKANQSWLMLLLFFGLPVTMIHAFSGLETLFFVCLLASLMIALYENRKAIAALLTILLFLTRPETWLLVVIVPTYFLIEEPSLKKISFNLVEFKKYLKELKFSWHSALFVFLSLAIPLAIYFLFHKLHFNSALPNTFYAKAGAYFNPFILILCIIFISPLFILLMTGRVKLFFALTAFFSAMAFSYSTSNLMMNYSERFIFHIFSPIFIFLVYFATKFHKEYIYVSPNENFKPIISISKDKVIKSILFLFYTLFLLLSTGKITDLAHVSMYYPRALDSHAALGKTLKNISSSQNIKSFSFGDAGMAAYHSKLIALDNIGLGSTLVTRQGLDAKLLDEYKPDLIVFHATPQGIHLDSHHQAAINNWAIDNKFTELCHVYWKQNYTLLIYSKSEIPEIRMLCETSKTKNNISDRAYIKKTIALPPWTYWRE